MHQSVVGLFSGRALCTPDKQKSKTPRSPAFRQNAPERYLAQ
ncbi:hypothetical protein [Vibrio vulnificus YJ016]|uniref:Uncharacterized protein n=1 Tax=Vibrio vulnificus (strain YJ016) TaxID=196600 RepID=Q7MJG5_VIBVY|nr:hypothetical protein [Vibrio vulnificus YJ016]